MDANKLDNDTSKAKCSSTPRPHVHAPQLDRDLHQPKNFELVAQGLPSEPRNIPERLKEWERQWAAAGQPKEMTDSEGQMR